MALINVTVMVDLPLRGRTGISVRRIFPRARCYHSPAGVTRRSFRHLLIAKLSRGPGAAQAPKMTRQRCGAGHRPSRLRLGTAAARLHSGFGCRAARRW